MTEGVARHLGREPHDDDPRGARARRSTTTTTTSPARRSSARCRRSRRRSSGSTSTDGIAQARHYHAAYEGPPGYVHGGWVALTFDEILGMTNIASGHPGMTGR